MLILVIHGWNQDCPPDLRRGGGLEKPWFRINMAVFDHHPVYYQEKQELIKKLEVQHEEAKARLDMLSAHYKEVEKAKRKAETRVPMGLTWDIIEAVEAELLIRMHRILMDRLYREQVQKFLKVRPWHVCRTLLLNIPCP